MLVQGVCKYLVRRLRGCQMYIKNSAVHCTHGIKAEFEGIEEKDYWKEMRGEHAGAAPAAEIRMEEIDGLNAEHLGLNAGRVYLELLLGLFALYESSEPCVCKFATPSPICIRNASLNHSVAIVHLAKWIKKSLIVAHDEVEKETLMMTRSAQSWQSAWTNTKIAISLLTSFKELAIAAGLHKWSDYVDRKKRPFMPDKTMLKALGIYNHFRSHDGRGGMPQKLKKNFATSRVLGRRRRRRS
ncbi:hypothetical protein QBC35DRAFT_533664 [Podospora australis]|uniref:Uncharacterized protein n=1 Tax=Podospora australis TaxID=1536484 RepID=A0AAN6WPT8_9PEZI|nr:hypothetical protein QBC35DRAFT_533664 [Podospora australis]